MVGEAAKNPLIMLFQGSVRQFLMCITDGDGKARAYIFRRSSAGRVVNCVGLDMVFLCLVSIFLLVVEIVMLRRRIGNELRVLYSIGRF